MRVFPDINSLQGIAWHRDSVTNHERGWRCHFPLAFTDAVRDFLSDQHLSEAWIAGIRPNQYQWPGLKAFATKLKQVLFEGCGFVLIDAHGINDFDKLSLKFLYLTIGMELGALMERYDRLYDVYDQGYDHTQQRVPVSQTNAATGFHTDSTDLTAFPDVVGLLCLQPAKTGGGNLLVSALEVHEQLRQFHPDSLRLLYQDFIRDIITPGEGYTLEKRRQNTFPVFSANYGQQLTLRYMRYWIETGHQKSGVTICPEAISALDDLDEQLNDPRNQLTLTLKRGNVLLVNNHLIAHSRTAYTELSAHQRRLMVRMWVTANKSE